MVIFDLREEARLVSFLYLVGGGAVSFGLLALVVSQRRTAGYLARNMLDEGIDCSGRSEDAWAEIPSNANGRRDGVP